MAARAQQHDADRAAALTEFVAWCRAHITGDEKGEAQVFLDRLFQAFGQPGILDVGRAEFRVKPQAEDEGGTRFADYVWKPVVLIEMKKRGEDLSRHVSQAFHYWTRLVPNKPAYAILCNFDKFRIYDFNADINEPQDELTLEELPDRYPALNFLARVPTRPIFRVDREEVTRAAADLLANVYSRLARRKDIGEATAQRFILQILVALFSEDIGLLPKNFVTQLLDDCTDPPKAFDLLSNLFNAMNAPTGTPGGRFKDVPYFNGGLFAQPAPVELDPADETSRLRKAASYNWAHISPDIFGTIFQHSMDKAEQHAFGAHYTAPADIMKIVGPTIIQPFTTAIDRASTLKELTALRDRLSTLKVLDPACGSGNFLYIAYREMRRLEARIIRKQSEVSKREFTGQQAFGAVSPRQFFGMDILPFAVELAKVTLSIAPKLASDELHTNENPLPLYNLDENILLRDALITDGPAGPARTPWPTADVIIGNPPFLGAKRLKPQRGVDYMNAVRGLYPEVPGMADYCVYWFRRAHDHLPDCAPNDPFMGRAGLVGTQNIRNNQSRVGGLDHIVKSGVIIEAVDNQPWSGEANVHVSIANWIKSASAKSKDAELLVLEPCKLWSKVDPRSELFEQDKPPSGRGATVLGKRGRIRMDKSFELSFAEVARINSALAGTTDVAHAKRLRCNTEPQQVFQGQVPGHEAFVLERAEARELISKSSRNRKVIWPFLIGRDVVTGTGQPTRFVIDFQDVDITEASSYKEPFARIEKHVLPVRRRAAVHGKTAAGKQRSHHQLFLRYWWRHSYDRPEMIRVLSTMPRYIVCSGVTKRPIFNFIRKDIRPDHAVFVFAFPDDYSFGLLQGNPHWRWFVAKCSKLKSDFRYTPPSVFDTFPWPQKPTKKQVRAVAAAGREIRRLRDDALTKITGGLRALYRTLELPGKSPLKNAHADLDAAVMEAYGFSAKKDLLAQILELNLSVAAAIDRGETVTAPGVPPSYGDPSDLITDDCIKP
jgi:hypothetical protein